MGNLARKLQQEQQQVQQQKQKKAIEKAKKNRFSFSPGEKILGLIFSAALCFGAVQMISNQAAIYEINKDIQETSAKIQSQERVNADLSMQVEELSTYERIWAKAKELGLNLNENNVKVVQD
ncbi:cell division protein FtsL [Robertmurraya andreesenii]|uniref:Cell division protein FtsL n=1 Tax=Anoxybacillus andreesenii TaxID=1325932 RepID=A0ABT9V4N6_9BACL|nr:cell division protein FtsL [Robertmurraya andreesenii]MDQ0155913.1 cell division protein FtsL [Robertmurraya andreesenii]